MSDNQIAACWGTDPESWFPEDNKPPAPELVALCNSCPIRQRCDAFAKKHGVYGVWAGVRYNVHDLKGAGSKKYEPLKPCGTEAAYVRHRRRKEQCDVCDKIRADNRVAAAQQAQAARRIGIPRLKAV